MIDFFIYFALLCKRVFNERGKIKGFQFTKGMNINGKQKEFSRNGILE